MTGWNWLFVLVIVSGYTILMADGRASPSNIWIPFVFREASTVLIPVTGNQGTNSIGFQK